MNQTKTRRADRLRRKYRYVDRGFVLLIDRRYRFSDHMNALPYSWRPEYSADEQKIIDRIVAFISEI